MIYYILAIYVFITLWFVTNCQNCIFSKPPFTIKSVQHNVTNPTYNLNTCSIQTCSI